SEPSLEEIGYGITNVWVDPDDIAEEIPATNVAELGKRMTDFFTTVRHDTDEIYGRLDDAQDDKLLMSGQLNFLRKDRPSHARTAKLIEGEAITSHEDWVQSMDASDTACSEVRTLRTTVLAQQTKIGDLRLDIPNSKVDLWMPNILAKEMIGLSFLLTMESRIFGLDGELYTDVGLIKSVDNLFESNIYSVVKLSWRTLSISILTSRYEDYSPEVNPVVPEPNQVVDIHDPNEMVDIPDDIDLVDFDEEDPEEEPEEDVEIELKDDAELIFPYEVEVTKPRHPGTKCHLISVSSDLESQRTEGDRCLQSRGYFLGTITQNLMLFYHGGPKAMFEARMREIIRDQVNASIAEFVANMNHRAGGAGVGGAGAGGAGAGGASEPVMLEPVVLKPVVLEPVVLETGGSL
ncbi:hypothetical protein Tco_0777092, partial [Tanacetum coccineum]